MTLEWALGIVATLLGAMLVWLKADSSEIRKVSRATFEKTCMLEARQDRTERIVERHDMALFPHHHSRRSNGAYIDTTTPED